METKPLAIDNHLLSIMERLKRETKTQHTQIEHLHTMKRLFADDYTLTEYRWHLEKMYGYLSVIEPLLLQHLQEEALQNFFLKRCKKSWLIQDLSHFGLSEEQILTLPHCPVPNYINNLSEALGVYYVLEGSSLGGQFIFKRLNQNFGEVVKNKLHFYQGYGEQTYFKWQQFSELLETHFAHETQAEITQMVTAAKLTFNSLAQWLTSKMGDKA